MVVDAHVHVCVMDTERYPFTPLLGYTPRAAAPVEALIARMAECELDAAVLVQPSYYGYDNRYLQESLSRYPDCLRGVGLADPFPPAGTAHRLPDGCVGVRLNAIGHPGRGWLWRTATAGFWAAAEERGLVVCAQCAPDQVLEWAAVAAAHPGVRCVIDHLGRGAWDDLGAAAALPNTFLKVSGVAACSAEAYPHRDVWPAALRAVEAFGPERCLWGSDASSVDLAACRAQVELWRDLVPLGAAERACVMGGTASALFFGA